MRKYIVDECRDTTAALQDALDYMSGRGWTLFNTTWIPRRKVWVEGVEEDGASQYVLIFEREATDTKQASGAETHGSALA